MPSKLFVGLALAAAALSAAGGAWAAEKDVPFQSGLHPGDRLASFLCRGVNGPNKGKPLCYV